jgi:hypothetical protein
MTLRKPSCLLFKSATICSKLGSAMVISGQTKPPKTMLFGGGLRLFLRRSKRTRKDGQRGRYLAHKKWRSIATIFSSPWTLTTQSPPKPWTPTASNCPKATSAKANSTFSSPPLPPQTKPPSTRPTSMGCLAFRQSCSPCWRLSQRLLRLGAKQELLSGISCRPQKKPFSSPSPKMISSWSGRAT